MAQGLAVIDAGHYGIEHIFIEDVAGYLGSRIAGVTVEKEKIRSPFVVL